MSSIKNNSIFENTSFLEGNNSSFIDEQYSKFIDNPDSIPLSWKEFFEALGEDKEGILKEISGPSWSPKKKNDLFNINKIKEKLQTNELSNIAKRNRATTIIGREAWTSIAATITVSVLPRVAAARIPNNEPKIAPIKVPTTATITVICEPTTRRARRSRPLESVPRK